ncbi:MAG: hypothetical protein WAW11_05175 [Patescibacteria group bacterium]
MKKVLVIEGDKRMLPLYSYLFKQKKEEYDVEFAVCIEVIQNRIEQHQDHGGLDYYDIVIMEPYISHYPLYDYKETWSAMQTGWFIYRDFMQNLTTPIIIWTYPIELYTYNESNYPDRAWGANVAGIFRKDLNSPYLLELIDKYARK